MRAVCASAQRRLQPIDLAKSGFEDVKNALLSIDKSPRTLLLCYSRSPLDLTPVSGIVLSPTGRPVADVAIARHCPSQGLGWQVGPIFNGQFQGGYFLDTSGTFTDVKGRFSLPLPTPTAQVMALADVGYGIVSREALETSGKVVLSPWGRITGVLEIDGRPAADWQVEVTSKQGQATDRPEPTVEDIPFSGSTTITDAEGRFVFERMHPGSFELACRYQQADVAMRELPEKTPVIVIGDKTTKVQVVGEMPTQAKSLR